MAGEILGQRSAALEFADVESSWFVSPPSPRAGFSVVFLLGANTAALHRIPFFRDSETTKIISLAYCAIDVLLRCVSAEARAGRRRHCTSRRARTSRISCATPAKR